VFGKDPVLAGQYIASGSWGVWKQFRASLLPLSQHDTIGDQSIFDIIDELLRGGVRQPAPHWRKKFDEEPKLPGYVFN